MKNETILIIDFGGKYTSLLARKIRANKVYSEVVPYDITAQEISNYDPKGLIITGDYYKDEEYRFDKKILELPYPILGITAGYEVILKSSGANSTKGKFNSFKSNLRILNENKLFNNIPDTIEVWMNDGKTIHSIPNKYDIIAKMIDNPVAAFKEQSKEIYGISFHPEVEDTISGDQILNNFLFGICNCSGDWNMKSFTNNKIEELKTVIGNKKVLCALSGGVDSSVCAVMIRKACQNKDSLTCIFVDTGLMRLNEGDEVIEEFSKFDINVIRVNAEDRFLAKLKDVTDPETKRKIIGEEFIRVFEEEAKKIGDVDFLVQGTIYPDIIESGTKNNNLVKSHHNVGGLPDVINFKEILEPLKQLFKDEVRETGLELGIDRHLVFRQPFPGPGLGVRVIGDLTKEKLDILRKVDFIFRDEIRKAGLDTKIWQYFAVLTGLKTVGVKNEQRNYGYTIALRAVNSVDAMTATWYKIPYELLEKISDKIVKDVFEVNRVVFDITNKPPATIEWE